MPTFPDDPDDTPEYAKVFTNDSRPAEPPRRIRFDNIRPIRSANMLRDLMVMTYQIDPDDIRVRVDRDWGKK